MQFGRVRPVEKGGGERGPFEPGDHCNGEAEPRGDDEDDQQREARLNDNLNARAHEAKSQIITLKLQRPPPKNSDKNGKGKENVFDAAARSTKSKTARLNRLLKKRPTAREN